MEVAIVLWLISGFISAVISSNNGRGARFGFWIGFLLGPFGIVLVLVMGGGIKCPECKGNVVRGATRCKNCGAMLATASAPKAEPTAAPKSDQDRHREMLEKFHSRKA